MKRTNRLTLVLLLLTTFLGVMINTSRSTVATQDPNPILFIHGD